MDFMHDSLADGTMFRVMTLIDLYSRECLAAVACRGFSGADHSIGSRTWTRYKGSSATGATTSTTIGRTAR